MDTGHSVRVPVLQDVAGGGGCAAGQEVLPDGQDQAAGVPAPAAEKPAPLYHRAKEGHCSSCEKRHGKGGFKKETKSPGRTMFNTPVPS